MPLDPSIPLQAQSPNPTTLISSFLNLGKQKLELDKSRETFDADVARTKAVARAAGTEADVGARTANARVSQTENESALSKFKLSGAQALQSMQLASGLLSDPDFVSGNAEGMLDKLNGAATTMVQQFGVDPKIADATITTLKYQALHDPKAVRQSLINMTQQQQGGAGQQAAALPAPALLSNGQQTVPVAAGNPALTGTPPGTPQGVPMQQQLPPTTPVMREGQPGYLGPQAAPPAPSAPPIASGPRLGQAEAVSGQVAPLVKHYETVVADASAAPTRIGILQEIKALAPQAITGDAPLMKQIISKLAAYTGWAGDSQTPTDVMAKESALLASKGGNTDLARVLNEAATPNGKMTKEAIQKTADQLIGLEKRAQAAQPYFAGTPTDSPLYAKKKAAWDQSADPRAFEYAGKTPDEQARMKAEMQKAGTWDALRQKMVQLHAMGISP